MTDKMTREQAILWMKVLKHAQINWVGEKAEEEDIIARCEEAEQEAIDMTIEALSADAVQKAVPTVVRVTMSDGKQYYLEHERDAIQTDAVQGKWKCMADCGVTECDQCGWSIEEYVGDYNYCPNCGAKMKGGDDE